MNRTRFHSLSTEFHSTGLHIDEVNYSLGVLERSVAKHLDF